MKDEKELTEPLESHFKFGKSQRKLTLVHFSAATQVRKSYTYFIPNITTQFNLKGKYECRGVNGFGTAAFSYHLNIEGSVKAREGPSVNVVIQQKVFIFQVLLPGILKNKTVTEGDSVSLSCKIQSSDLLFVRK